MKNFSWATYGRRESPKEILGKLESQKKLVPILPSHPLVSLVVSDWDEVPPEQRARCLESLELQSYPYWEMLLVGKRSGSHSDERIRFLSTEDTHAVARKNVGITKARGEWVGLLSASAFLNPALLFELVKAGLTHKHVDVYYTNEIELGTDGKIKRFLTKPEFSWFDLIHFNYLHQGWFARKSAFRQVGPLAPEELHEHDWHLRACEAGKEYALLPLFGFHGPSAFAPGPSADLARLAENHLRRKSFRAEVKETPHGIDITPNLPTKKPKISVIVAFRDKAEWTVECIRKLEMQTRELPLELILMDNESAESQTKEVEEAARALSFPYKLVPFKEPFNFARIHNTAVREHCTGEILVLLNNDVFLEDPNTLSQMARWASLPWVGTVGIQLLFPDRRVQHGGFRAVSGGLSRIARIHHAQDSDCFVNQNHEVFGNTFAACAFKRSTYEQLNGMNELEFYNGYSDVAFNFECLDKGLHNLYLGNLKASHIESGTRGLSYEYWEEMGIEKKYPGILQRMLRYDLGYDRIPDSDLAMRVFLKSTLSSLLSKKIPWLLRLRGGLKGLAAQS